MIRKKFIPARDLFREALCDACGAALPMDEYGLHHGGLVNSFGYGHPHEGSVVAAMRGREDRVDLCGACWEKACAAVGLSPTFEKRLAPTPVIGFFCATCGSSLSNHRAECCSVAFTPEGGAKK